MAKKEKISEERRKLIKEFISSNELKTASDVEDALKKFIQRYTLRNVKSWINRGFRLRKKWIYRWQRKL